MGGQKQKQKAKNKEIKPAQINKEQRRIICGRLLALLFFFFISAAILFYSRR